MIPTPAFHPSISFARSPFAALILAGALAALAGQARPTQAQPCSGCGLGSRTIETFPMDGLPARNTSGYPLVQVCPVGTGPGVVAAKGASAGDPGIHLGPDCLFSGLYLTVKAHASPITRLDSIRTSDYPPGMHIIPRPIPFPNYACPLEFRAYLPPIQVNCGSTVFHGASFEAYLGFCNGTGAGRQWVRGGYWLKCVKQDQSAAILGNQHSWVSVPFVNAETTSVVFALRNADPFPRNINLLTTFNQPWAFVTAPPTQVSLGPLASTHIVYDVIVPAGTPEGTLGNLSLAASFADVPSPVVSDEVQIHVGDDPLPEPPLGDDINDLPAPVPLFSAETLVVWAIAMGLAGLVVLARRRRSAA